MKSVFISGLFTLFVLLAAPVSLFANGQTAEEAQGEKAELLWFTGGGSFADAPDVFNALGDELESMGRNYSVRFESFEWADYTQKMQLIITSGEKADIVFMSSWTGNYFTNAAAGYLTELDAYLEGQPALRATMGPQFWNAVRVGGKIYAVPNFKDMVYQEYAAFNSDIVEEFNIQLPEGSLTYRSMTPLLERFAELGTGFDPYRGSLVMPFRGDFPLGRNLPIALSFAEPEKGFQVVTEIAEYQDYARLMREWAEKGYRNKDEYLNRNRPVVDQDWFLSQYQGFPGAETIMEDGLGVELETRFLNAPPVLDNATPLGAMLSVPSVSSNVEEAMDFIALLNTDSRIRNLVGYGIEGVHYNLDENGQVEATERAKNNYGVPNFSLGSLLVLNTAAGEPVDARDRLRRFNEDAEASPAMGFEIDKKKYSQVIAQVTAAFPPYLDSVVYGLRPAEENLTEAREKLKELGWFEAVAEINRSYMDWKERR